MASLRVLVATGLYPPQIGGPATHTVHMQEALPAHGFSVRVAAFSSVAGLPKGIAHFAYTLQLVRAARTADIIFAQDTVSVGLPALLASLVARRPLVVRVPGDHAWEHAVRRGVTDSLDEFQTKRYGIQTEFLRMVSHEVVRRARCTIVPSAYLASIVRTWVKDPARVHVVRNGVAVPPITPAVPLARPLAVCVGRLVPWKGVRGIIQALPPLWHLVVVGDGPEENMLRACARESGAEERVHFLGRLSREESLSWVVASDAFVLNSSYEGMSHLLAEAMTLGAPIVVSDIPANRELIKDGAEGILVPLNDRAALTRALEHCAAYPEEARTRGAHARARAHEFSLEHTSAALAALLRLCVS